MKRLIAANEISTEQKAERQEKEQQKASGHRDKRKWQGTEE